MGRPLLRVEMKFGWFLTEMHRMSFTSTLTGALKTSTSNQVGKVFSQFRFKYSSGPSDDSMKITLAGVYYKPSEYDDGKIEAIENMKSCMTSKTV